MNFFLDFVSCCGSPSRHSLPTASPPSPEETRSLVILPASRTEEGSRYQRRKRGKFGARRSGSAAAEWRPSLYAISEDNVAPEKYERTKAARSERVVKRKVAPTARTHAQSHRDEFGRTSLPTIIPVFSATPFLF